jgi:phosphoribosylglycinamide formyltransferase-1
VSAPAPAAGAAEAAGETGAAPVVMLATDGPSTRIVYHALAADFPGLRVIVEEPVSRSLLLKRRARKLGVLPVLGQVAFMGAVLPVLRRAGAARVEAIRREYELDESPLPEDAVVRLASVNSPEARERLRALSPRVVVVNGTRIIGRETLRATDAVFLNLHAGITPAYRGVHGGYWALAEGRPELVGSTVHLVDEGIDTGTVVEQATFTPSSADSFATYPYLHTAAALPALKRAVRAAMDGTLRTRPAPAGLESRLRHHPTAAGYLAGRLLRGVR